jgi:GNAT superfamily N-acetyltransferase
MKKELTISKCSLEDAKELAEIAVRAYRDHYLYLWNDDGSWYVNRSFTIPQFQKELKDPNAAFFILKENAVSIGFMKLNLEQPLEGFESFSALELERIYLLKSASRKGFGREALEYCFQLALQMSKQIVWLKSMDSSGALYFYKDLGFEECGTFRLDFEIMKPEYRGMKIFMKKLK